MRIGSFIVCFCLAVSAYSQAAWARYRLMVLNGTAAQRVIDSNLELFSEQVAVGATDVIVGPNQLGELLRLQLPFRYIQTLPEPDSWSGRGQGDGIPDYRTEYLTYDQVIAQYEEWRLENPDRVTRQLIGTTHDGRPIWAYKLAPPLPPPPSVLTSIPIIRSVVIFGGTHAREWIGPAVVMYLFHELLEQSKSSFPHALLAGKLNLHAIPVVNPDGYVYTWTNNRYWRKNRRDNGNNIFGVDLNRNFAKGWGGPGSSGNPGSSTYRGPAPFSEPESSAVRDYVADVLPLPGFIDYHSYGEKILWPWSWTYDPPPDAARLFAFGEVIRLGTLGVHGHNYVNGQASRTLYIASGTTKDYYYDEYGAMSYTIELRDTGRYGFLLPEDQILPTQQESWAGLEGFMLNLLNSITP